MKRIFAIVTALVLSLSLCVTAHAADGGIIDAAGLMSGADQNALQQEAQAISEQYDIAVYAITVDDYQEFTDGEIEDAADYFYGGLMEENAILLMLSMYDRDYLLIAYGDAAQYAFNDEGREYLADYFLDDFSNDDWYYGFSDYISWCGEFMEAAENGEPFPAQTSP